jgi:hypothetical protein
VNHYPAEFFLLGVSRATKLSGRPVAVTQNSKLKTQNAKRKTKNYPLRVAGFALPRLQIVLYRVV